jgi:hypothetical protein
MIASSEWITMKWITMLAAQFAGVYATSWSSRGPEERAALIDSFVLDLVISSKARIAHTEMGDLNALRAQLSDKLATCHMMISPHAPHAQAAPSPPMASPPLATREAVTDEADEVTEALRRLNPETLATMLSAGRPWMTTHQFRALVSALRAGGRVMAGRTRGPDGREEHINPSSIRALVRGGYLNHEITSSGSYTGTLSDRTRAAIAAMWRDWATRRVDRMSWRSLSDHEVIVLRPDGGSHVRIVSEMASDEDLARAADAIVASGMR